MASSSPVLRASTLFALLSWLARARASDPTTYAAEFSKTGSAGPDGPWNVINQTVDFPDQNILMYPSLSKTSVFVAKTACQPTNANCPAPVPGLWTPSGAQAFAKAQDGPLFDAVTWDALSEPLGLQGQGHYIADRITLQSGSSNIGAAFIDNAGVTISDNFSITYPGGAKYTMDVGLLSLYGGENTFSYSNKSGSPVTINNTMSSLFINKYVPSKSYGLHLGSVAYKVPATLYFGGYDSSRCLSDPILAATDNTFQLKAISLNVSSGGNAYIKGAKNPNANFKVRLEPGAPYMYLPRSVCDTMAAHLPVTYNKDFNLYTWNLNSEAYNPIISSPHFLSFTFSDANTTPTNVTSINIPFSLLSLNLSAPISTVTTPYFPCRPYTPSDSQTYILGRAFLQGAFVAQHWQAGKLWLAQAPGPYIPPGSVVTFSATDSSIVPSGNQVSWDTTWSTVLKPLASDVNSSNGGTASSSGTTTGLSTGAKAGIGVGVALGVLLLAGLIALLLISRRKKRRAHEMAGSAELPPGGPMREDHKYAPPGYRPELYSQTRHELPPDQVNELPGAVPHVEQTKPVNDVPQELPAGEVAGTRGHGL